MIELFLLAFWGRPKYGDKICDETQHTGATIVLLFIRITANGEDVNMQKTRQSHCLVHVDN